MKRILLISSFFSVCQFSFGQDTATVKEKYEYEFCVKQEQTPGEILKNKRVGIADTTVAFLSGQLKHLSGQFTEKNEAVPFANVTVTGKENSFSGGTQSDVDGYFSIYLVAGQYDVEFSSIGYAPVKLENLALQSGEIREVEVELGEASGFVTYGVTTDKPMTEKQYKKWWKKLTKEHAGKK